MSTMPYRDVTTTDTAEVILGVDTHRDEHVAAVLTPLGALVATGSYPATAEGYRQLLTWARTFGHVGRAGVECTGSYGAALTRHLQAEGITVVEVNRADRAERRRRGKTDTLDARPPPGQCCPDAPPQSPSQATATSRCFACSSRPRPPR